MKAYFLVLCFAGLLPISLIAQPVFLWNYPLQDMSFGNSALADIDLDGKLEIVFSTYRNDSCVYALNAEDGSLCWKVNTGGCNDAAPLIFDVDGDDTLEVILASSCVPKTFCFNGPDGELEWEINTRGSDSPPSIADLDGDGSLEILHGEFGGYVICIHGEDGTLNWELEVDVSSWVQTAPAILDLNNDQQLDFVVGTWNFNGDSRIYAFTGDSAQLIWSCDSIADYVYHGVSFADIDDDGNIELLVGDYSGVVYCLNAESGSVAWTYQHPAAIPQYVGAPTTLADFNHDGHYEILVVFGNTLALLSNQGILLWDYVLAGYANSFRGGVSSDVNQDDTLDVVFGTSSGYLKALSGSSGQLIFEEDLGLMYGQTFEIDHAPVIGDFNKNGINDVYVVGGHAEYPAIENNYGMGYAFEIGGTTPSWPMFRYNERRSGAFPLTPLADIEESEDFNTHLWLVDQHLTVQVDPLFALPGKIQLVSLDGKLLFSDIVHKSRQEFTIPVHSEAIILYQLRNSTQKSSGRLLSK